jgi:iron-sulfur cluster repair protein YtfE (RIC family)
MQQTLRFNPFHQVHQGLRALLCHASLALQHTDFGNLYHTGATLSLLEEMVDLFEQHAHAEDTLVFPMIADHSPNVVLHFEQQHEKDHSLMQDLFQCMEQCRKASGSFERTVMGRILQRCLSEFMSFNLTHMTQEESIVLPVIWQYYTDEEIQEKHLAVTASFSQEKKERMGYWMLKGLNEQEIITWFEGLQKNTTPAVFNRYMQLAAAALPPEKFRQLSEILMGGFVAQPGWSYLKDVCTPV